MILILYHLFKSQLSLSHCSKSLYANQLKIIIGTLNYMICILQYNLYQSKVILFRCLYRCVSHRYDTYPTDTICDTGDTKFLSFGNHSIQIDIPCEEDQVCQQLVYIYTFFISLPKICIHNKIKSLIKSKIPMQKSHLTTIYTTMPGFSNYQDILNNHKHGLYNAPFQMKFLRMYVCMYIKHHQECLGILHCLSSTVFILKIEHLTAHHVSAKRQFHTTSKLNFEREWYENHFRLKFSDDFP